MTKDDPHSVAQLETKRIILDKAIRYLRARGHKDGELGKVIDQQRRVNELLVSTLAAERQRRGISEPPAQRVRLKPLRATGRRIGFGGERNG